MVAERLSCTSTGVGNPRLQSRKRLFSSPPAAPWSQARTGHIFYRALDYYFLCSAASVPWIDHPSAHHRRISGAYATRMISPLPPLCPFHTPAKWAGPAFFHLLRSAAALDRSSMISPPPSRLPQNGIYLFLFCLLSCLWNGIVHRPASLRGGRGPSQVYTSHVKKRLVFNFYNCRLHIIALLPR